MHEANGLKNEVDHLGAMVDEKEKVAQKLEGEIVQWDPLSKLARRDIELKFIEGTCTANTAFLKNEEQFGLNEINRLWSQGPTNNEKKN